MIFSMLILILIRYYSTRIAEVCAVFFCIIYNHTSYANFSIFRNFNFLNNCCRTTYFTKIIYFNVSIYTDIWINIAKVIYMRVMRYKSIFVNGGVNAGRGSMRTRLLTPTDIQRVHENTRDWLAQELQTCEKSEMATVVLTHHAPSFLLAQGRASFPATKADM